MDIDEVLEQRFGLAAFRPWQREAVEHLLEGSGQVLVVAPTGGGKSLCYQLPAVMLEGTSVVISPLIALMEDQVRSLSERGIAATYLASTLTPEERRERLRDLSAGRYRLVYVAPERLRSDHLVEWLCALRPPLVAIDEAHCISQWGHDFRPDYLRIGAVLRALRPERVLACTATATPAVRDEILDRLALPRAETRVVLRGFARPNLHLEVREVDSLTDRRRIATEAAIRAAREGAAIIYTGTRKLSDRLAGELRERGCRSAAYHAGLESAVRERVNAAFAARELDVVVATNAFGMGIDRSDIRIVVHLQAPGSIEQYYQEVGRAGRDGQPAHGLLLAGTSDFGLRRRLLELSLSERSGERADGARGDEAWLRWQWNMFLDLMRYVEAGSCRHDFILRYFGDEGELLGGCGHCDVCERLERMGAQEADAGEVTLVIRKALSGVARLQARAGLNVLAAHLNGSSSERVRRLGLDQLSTHGLLSAHEPRWILALLRRLITAGLVDITAGDYPMPFLTAEGRKAMKGEQPVRLLLPPGDLGHKRPRRAISAQQAPGRFGEEEPENADPELFERLREVRIAAARDRGIPAYVVCHDRTLREMAAIRPTTLSDLTRVHGMGPARVEAYGELFLTAIRSHQAPAC